MITIPSTIEPLISSLPPMAPGIGGTLLTAAQTFATLASYKTETNPDTRAQYSKFASQISSSSIKMISSRDGMLIIYAPAFVASSIAYFGDIATSPAALLCLIHFAKRVLEVLFLHKYSGSVSLAVSSGIGAYYTLIACLICGLADRSPSEASLALGTALFLIGIAGNFYHHNLLANLRQSKPKQNDDDTTKKYVPPTGGLFEYVAAPHYLFELIGWFGIAIASQQLNVYLVFASMSSYLSGRAVAQNEFNRETFSSKEWPETRKNLIPFVF